MFRDPSEQRESSEWEGEEEKRAGQKKGKENRKKSLFRDFNPVRPSARPLVTEKSREDLDIDS